MSWQSFLNGSPLESRSGRMVGAMDEDVTVEARAGRELRARRRRGHLLLPVDRRHIATGEVGAAVDLCGVVAGVALLAQIGRARLEQRRQGRAVRCVAADAAFDDRRVLPEERAALLGVTGVAGLVHR